MQRREILQGGAAMAAVAVIPATIANATVEMSVDFESAQWCDRPYAPDEWPDEYRQASDAAIKRLLDRYPHARVIEDRMECWDEHHPRFAPFREFKFVLVRSIKVDPPLPAEY